MVTASLLVSAPAFGQELVQPQNQAAEVDFTKSVADRPIDTPDVRFFRLGSWTLRPAIEFSETYDSNIYATESDEKDDFITVVKPRVRLASDWNVHQVSLEAGGDFGFYGQYNDENYQDYYLDNRNRFEIVRGTNLIIEASGRHAHEPRTSAENIAFAKEPLQYDVLSGTIGVEHDLADLAVRVDAKVDKITYEDSKAIGGGDIDNSYRDYLSADAGIRLSYQPFHGAEAYLNTRLTQVSYDDATKFGGPDRDNHGFTVTAGAKKSFSDVWVVDAYLGYAPKYYADASLEDVTDENAIVFGSSLLWNPTSLTSVIGSLERRTYETTQSGASALVNTGLSVRVEHQLRDSVILDGGIDYNYGDYYGSAREDRTYSGDLGLSYYFTKLVSLRASYGYSQRDSSEAGSDYDKHLGSLQVRLNY